MNPTQLRKIGIPDDAIPDAIQALQIAISSGALNSKDVKSRLAQIVADPSAHVADPQFGTVAQRLLEPDDAPLTPIPYRTWGSDIDPAAHGQMRQACSLPMVVGGALMPDAHVGYGLPIGGVLALDNAVVPYAVGVDIACRMKLSVLDIEPDEMDHRYERFRAALENGTRFGVGSEHQTPQDHPVMDENWSVTRITREHKDKARRQLGTSGSGNHFVEFGTLTITARDEQLGLDAGKYTALLSHSGSRGTGAAVCDTYSRMAEARLPKKYRELGRLAWLSLDDEAGQEYWAAMNLMGDYAAANHAVIHRLVSKLLGARVVSGVENHHNFAWKERHQGRDVIVHRKGATPAGPNVLGIIPGSMASPAFVVKGKDHPESFSSASHGAGRCMSRTAARDKYSFRAVQKDLLAKGVHVLSAGSDEVPFVYKDILKVMQAQTDLVDVIARFDPKIVKMSDDGRAED
ncbi:MAG TPA: RtcB family protein [Planctomycetaceae bacterium]|nr:RtcB family protein [Planctomycetaceae bacterium]